MKKIVTISVSVFVLLAYLVFGVSAISGTFNNYSDPRPLSLSTASGCGNNTIGIYIDLAFDNYSARQSVKYKWERLSGNSDVLSACNAVRINVTNDIFVTMEDENAMSHRKNDQFYGDEMALDSYYIVGNNSLTVPERTVTASFTYRTVVRNPFNQEIINSDTCVCSFPPFDED